nr:vacuolar protein sorting-associated protein 32 homolog 2 [Tanacetum cinerariifolium]
MPKTYGNKTHRSLETKEKLLQKRIAAELEKAKAFAKANNKRAAIQCLKRKKLYEQQRENLVNSQWRIHEQDELEAELEELEGLELEEQLLQPAPVVSQYVPAKKQPARMAPFHNTAEEDELAALTTEPAL